MDLKSTILQVALAIILFFLTNWIGKHSIAFGYLQLSLFVRNDEAPVFNFLIRILTPVVFIILATAVLFEFGWDILTKEIYLVVVYYFAFRVLFNVLTGRSRLINWPMQLVHFGLGSSLAYWAYDKFLRTRATLLPDFQSISNELWLILLIFVYHVFNKMSFSDARTIKRKTAYLTNRFILYRGKYHHIISSRTNNKKLHALFYAIMIYEAFNRPKLYRIIESVLFKMGFSKTVGIMQVTSDKSLSDSESVELGVDKLIKDASAILEQQVDEWDIERALISKYNGGERYLYEIEQLLKLIEENFYSTSKHKLSQGLKVIEEETTLTAD